MTQTRIVPSGGGRVWSIRPILSDISLSQWTQDQTIKISIGVSGINPPDDGDDNPFVYSGNQISLNTDASGIVRTVVRAGALNTSFSFEKPDPSYPDFTVYSAYVELSPPSNFSPVSYRYQLPVINKTNDHRVSLSNAGDLMAIETQTGGSPVLNWSLWNSIGLEFGYSYEWNEDLVDSLKVTDSAGGKPNISDVIIYFEEM